MAKYVLMLGGEKIPQFILRYEGHGKVEDLPYSEELYTLMSSLSDSLKMGAVPLGHVYDSPNGFVREPYTPGDPTEVKYLGEYDEAERAAEAKRHEEFQQRVRE